MLKKGLHFLFVVFVTGQLYSQADATKQMVLAWDCSFSMQNRELESDFKFLDNYFKRNPDLKVRLVFFANEVVDTSEFQVVGGIWEPIQEKLKTAVYDGATNFKAVENQISLEQNELLLFTDGAQTFGLAVPDFGIKTLIINSNPYKEQNDLNALLVANKGRLFDYGRPLFSEKAAQLVASKEEEETTANNQPTPDSLATGPGFRLDEVVVQEKKRIENPVETQNIGNGEVDKNRLGVAAQSIGEERLPSGSTNVVESVQGKFSGVEVKQDLSHIKMRTDNSMQLSNYGLIVLDGIPQQQTSSGKGSTTEANFGFIDPENIADITVLKGMAATTRYGTLGANGVILITTKSAKGAKVASKPVDRARLTNNIYKGDLTSGKKDSEPSYIKELKTNTNSDMAYATYLLQRTDHLSSPAYFMEVYDYFKAIDVAKAQRILSNIAELNAKNSSLLRVLAYKYDVEGASANAFKINEQILDLDDRSSQAKFELALSAENTKKYGLAYTQLTELAENKNPQENDYAVMNKPVTNELRNLLHTEGTNISPTEKDRPYANQVHFDARILVMWSKSTAEFELQIINPDKRFFTWEHSEFGDRQRYLSDVKNDANTEEFQLIDAQKGDWYIKVNDLAEFATLEPVYLKCVVFYNFGLPSQRKEVQMVPLASEGDNESFFRIRL